MTTHDTGRPLGGFDELPASVGNGGTQPYRLARRRPLRAKRCAAAGPPPPFPSHRARPTCTPRSLIALTPDDPSGVRRTVLCQLRACQASILSNPRGCVCPQYRTFLRAQRERSQRANPTVTGLCPAQRRFAGTSDSLHFARTGSSGGHGTPSVLLYEALSISRNPFYGARRPSQGPSLGRSTGGDNFTCGLAAGG